MKYRIFNKQKSEYESTGMWIHTSGIIARAKKHLSRKTSIEVAVQDLYEIEPCIECVDANKTDIYVNDILKSNEEDLIGVVGFVPEQCGYVFLDYKNYKWYPLGEEVCKRLVIVGDIHNNYELLGINEEEAKKKESIKEE